MKRTTSRSRRLPRRRGANALRGIAIGMIAGVLAAPWAPVGAAGGVTAADPLAPPAHLPADAPGDVHRIDLAHLPVPFATPSAGNPARIVTRPRDAWPRAPAGFKVERYGSLDGPRAMRTAPNGDIFVAQSDAGVIRVLRGVKADGSAAVVAQFASGLDRPYGMAFWPPGGQPQFVYVGLPDAVIRFAYVNGDLKARGSAQQVADLPGAGGHWTRDLQFAADGATLYVAVGSASNVDESGRPGAEDGRADILALDPDGSHRRVYASGLRNPAGLALDPETGALWCAVNERDGLGDDLVPDYVTRLQQGGFYGWPWWYLGLHPDPRHAGRMPAAVPTVLVPDVLLQAHSAPLQLTFYTGRQFPARYRSQVFATAHGSWNRSVRTGYKVILVNVDRQGRASGAYEDFLTGFMLPDGAIWGRPVGITVALDGALLVSDDASDAIWRVRFVGP
jgi:glucose/arabinose dehydrogenase